MYAIVDIDSLLVLSLVSNRSDAVSSNNLFMDIDGYDPVPEEGMKFYKDIKIRIHLRT